MPESILIAGAQRSGKTHFTDQLIQKSNRKTLIVDSDGYEKTWQKYKTITADQLAKIKGKARILYDEDDPMFFRRIREQFLNGFLVFDDAMFFLADRRAEQFRKLFMKNRQMNNDIVFICHGLSEVPPGLWPFFSVLILFRTVDAFERSKSKIPNFEVMAERVIEVNNQAAKNPFHKTMYRLR